MIVAAQRKQREFHGRIYNQAFSTPKYFMKGKYIPKERRRDMSCLNYEKQSDGMLIQESKLYKVDSLYSDARLNQMFMQLKANVCDLNPALVTKCITGTEQDFIMLMNRAKEYVESNFREIDEETTKQLLEMFQHCVFGYYIITPLIFAKEVSDIKIYDYNHITVKANGERYVAQMSFLGPEDYRTWYERILRIHRLGKSDEYALNHCTDRKGVDTFYLRIVSFVVNLIIYDYWHMN